MSTTAHSAACSFVERLARDLQDARFELPAFPEAVLRVQQALQSPDTSTADIVAILSSDLVGAVSRTDGLVASKILAGENRVSEPDGIPGLAWLNAMKKHGAAAVLVDHDEEIRELRASLGD